MKPSVVRDLIGGRMEKYFDEPLDSKPDRWLRRRGTATSQPSNEKKCAYASLPFGVGARMCIGRRAAELEMSLLVAAFVWKFPCRLAPDSPEAKIKLNMVLGPLKPISLLLEKR